MKTEISRDSHQPKKRYSGVYQQQGRMLTDADWNELVEILKERLNDALKDIVGSKEGGIGGTPRHRALKIVQQNPEDNLAPKPKLEIQPGHVYVDGIAAQIPGDTPLACVAQPDFPEAPDFPTTPDPSVFPPKAYIIYADVWERTVTHLMDERLRDKGLHGADTCTRKQTMAQVKWCPYDSVDPANPDNIDPEQSAKNPSKGNAELTVTLRKKTTQPDPCDPCAAQLDVESKIGNYLFRVEVHDVIKGDANNPPEVTIKWSSENGAEQYALKDAEGEDVELPDEFKSGQWAYEFFDETSERHLGMHLAPDFTPSRGELTDGYPDTPGSVPMRSFVRRWDGYATFNWVGMKWQLTAGKNKGDDLSVDDISSTIADKVLKLDSVELKLQLLNPVIGGPVTSNKLLRRGTLHLADLEINGKEILCDQSSAKDKTAAINRARASVVATANTVLEGSAPSEMGDIDAGILKVNGKDIGKIFAADNVKDQADAVVNAINEVFSTDDYFSASKTPEGAILLTATDERNIDVEIKDSNTSKRCGFEQRKRHYDSITLTPTSPSNPDITIAGANPGYAGFAAGTTPAVQFVAGDYWLADVREVEHEVDSVLIENKTPQGIEHHYLTLGKVVKGVLQPNPEADRKYAFPPLTEMTRMFHVGGDGQEAMPEHGLPHPLQAGVGSGEWPVEGAKVRFEVENPDGVDPNDLGSLDPPTPAVVTTDENGIAECAWTLGATGKQQVKVTLLDPDDPSDSTDLDHSPIYFNANLSVASNVSYDPSEKADRWRDINEEEEGEILPLTVQEAIDDLADNLQSEDIKYTPSCTGDTPPTVRSQLEIPADTSSRVHEVLDKLLCDFNATHLPIDKDDEELCGRLKVEGIETVQDALDTLCRMERGGGCAVTVGENGGQYPTLKEAFDALAVEENISLCLMPGNHQVAAGLDISGKNSIKISGAGSQGSVIEAQGNMKLAADEIQFKDFGVDVANFEHGICLQGNRVGADGCTFTRTDFPDNIHLWSKNYKSTGREYGQGVAVDSEGNMLVTGYFTGKVDFGGKILTATREDLFVAKLSPKGELIWAHNYSSTGNEHGLEIAVDTVGNVVVTGHFDGEVTFGSQILNAEGTDLFVLKLEPKAGTVIWARNFKSSSSEKGHGVAVDGQGNVLLTGYFEGVVDADGNWLIANGTDLFVIKLEPKEGKVIWAHNYKSEGNEHGMDIAVDPEGYVFLTGYFDGAVVFGEFKFSAKGTDLFVLKLEPEAGNVLWAHNYQNEGNEHGMGITVDSEGYVILTGYFDGKVAFGEFELRAEGTDMFVFKLEPKEGKVLWVNNYSRIGVDYGMAVAADADGNVFVTGYFNTKTIFGDLRMRPSGEDMFVLKLDPEGKEIWVKQFGGVGDQRGLGIAVTPKGYVHVTGYFSGHADFDGNKLSAMGIDLFALMLEPKRGDVSWVRNFVNVSDETANAVAVDPDGNVLVTGKFSGAVDFGGSKLEARGIDLFVLKLRTDGGVVWARNYQGTGSECGYGIAADRQGNVLVTGQFDGELVFGDFKLTSADTDLFVLKLSPDGKVVWAQNYKSTGSEGGSSVAADADGNVLVTGHFDGTVVFDDFQLSATGTGFRSAKAIDLFVLKLNPDGKVVWAQNYLSTGADTGVSVAVDADGNVLVTGIFTGKVDIGGKVLTAVGMDLFVFKLSPDGKVVWAQNYLSTGADIGVSMAVDADGNVLVTGAFTGEVEFGEFDLLAEGTDLFVLKLSRDGEVVWARNYQGTGLDRGNGVAVDARGHVLVTGYFAGEVNFDGRPLVADGKDVFVLKLNTEGRVVWAHNFISTGNEYGNGIAVDWKGNVLVTGYFDGTVNFGGGTLTSVGTDLFITKLAIPAAAPPLVEVRHTEDKEEADLNWNRNAMQMPPAGDAVANPGLRLDGLFDALALSGSTIGGNVENNRIFGRVVLMSDLPDSMDIDPEGTVVGLVMSHKMPFIAQSVLNIRSNELNNIYSRIPLGALQNGILRNNELEFFGSMMITNNTFREKESSFFSMRMTMTGNQFIGADKHSDVAAIVLGVYGTFSDNQAHRNAMIQRLMTFKKQSSNDLNFQDLTGSIGKEQLVLLNGEETEAGTIMAFSAEHSPDGWKECDGSQISRAEYAALFDAIGAQFGAGNGSTTFNIPDLRGEFIRGWDGQADIGTGQGYATALPTNRFVTSYSGAHNHINILHVSEVGNLGGGNRIGGLYDTRWGANGGIGSSGSNHTHSIVGGDNETRPRNVAMMFCIKY